MKNAHGKNTLEREIHWNVRTSRSDGFDALVGEGTACA